MEESAKVTFDPDRSDLERSDPERSDPHRSGPAVGGPVAGKGSKAGATESEVAE